MCQIATFQCHAAMHPLCFTCWEKHYEGGEGKCPLCRSKLSTRRNIVAEKFLEKLEKKKSRVGSVAASSRTGSVVASGPRVRSSIASTATKVF